ncbi:MAG: pimeloyl-ACP methyl ester carboxylesterase [Glaciecola sp.]|jgi:pimeloyl-ACP methyl ester carboxylesterase
MSATAINNTVKPTLVFVHGYLGGSLQWRAQVVAFSEYYNVVTPDLPGYGLNNTLESPETIDGYARYVLDELDKQGIDRFHLLGHSMGGMIVQEMFAQAPARVDKLILYGTGPIGVMPGRFESIDESKQRLINDGVPSSARRISAKWFVDGADSCVYPGCADIAVLASAQAAVAGLSAMSSWSGNAALPKIIAPTLVLWGDQDQSYLWAQPEALWKNIPGASLSVVPGCSHAVHLEKPALFNAILRDFLMT